MLSTTINKQFEGNSNYRGVMYQEHLMNSGPWKTGDFAVLNTDLDIPNPPFGIHWVALMKRDNGWWYFDSLNDPTIPYVKRFCRGRITRNTEKLQPDSSTLCGRWCLVFLLWALGVPNQKSITDFERLFPSEKFLF